jgi:hypothetical protein
VTPGNLELVEVIVSWAVTLPLVAALIVRDERGLSGRRRERGWPPVSRDACIYGLWLFGVHPLALLVHFTKTRWTWDGFGLGFRLLLAVNLADDAAQLAVAAAIQALGL